MRYSGRFPSEESMEDSSLNELQSLLIMVQDELDSMRESPHGEKFESDIYSYLYFESGFYSHSNFKLNIH